MYRIYADDLCIYDDISPEQTVKVLSPKLIMEDSSAGSLTMTVPQMNVGYSSIKMLTTDITVYRFGKELWSGRVLTEERGLYGERVLYCEGELAFLNDSIQPQAELHNVTVEEFLSTLIANHNAKVAPNRQFSVGNVTVTDPNDSLYRYTNYETTMECITDKMLDRLGGHFRIRKVGGVRFLDYLRDYPRISSQSILFGHNLLDFTQKWDMTDFATVILPLGEVLEDSDIPALTSYLTVESVNDGDCFVASDSAVEEFGRIEKVVHWDDVKTPERLLRKARKYLTDTQFDKMSIDLSAVDLNNLDVSCESFELLDRVPMISIIHGIKTSFPITRIEIPLDCPEETVFHFGYRESMD